MSHESSLSIPAGAVTLEARLAPGTAGALWVICHPLPRYGGTMDNNVVIAARDALLAAGRPTLRFNFRGVGRSTGAEANDERDAADLLALLAHVSGRPEAEEGVCLAGYSFGAWAALRALADRPAGGEPPAGDTGLRIPRALMLFSPPVDFLPFDELVLPDVPCLVAAGDRDEFCSLRSLDAWWGAQPAATAARVRRVLPGVDHFYGGGEKELRKAIQEFLSG